MMPDIMTTYRHLRLQLLWAVVLMLSGCADEGDVTVGWGGGVLRPVVYTSQLSDVVTTRADDAESLTLTGYSPYSSMGQQTTIGLFLNEGSSWDDWKGRQTITLTDDGTWESQTLVKGDVTYSIYGVMGAEDEITSTEISANSDSTVTLKFKEINPLTLSDICILTSVNAMPEYQNDIHRGRFTYTGKTENNVACLLFDHLFASVRFHLKVGSDYSQLRSVRLKSLTLRTNGMGPVTMEVKVGQTKDDSDPIREVKPQYSSDNTTAMERVLYDCTGTDDTDGLLLRTDVSQTFACNFETSIHNSLSLESVYDVYDRSGNRIRSNCKAVNRLPELMLDRGQRRTLVLTIEPTYLYVLSDPDLDNPTVNIKQGE